MLLQKRAKILHRDDPIGDKIKHLIENQQIASTCIEFLPGELQPVSDIREIVLFLLLTSAVKA